VFAGVVRLTQRQRTKVFFPTGGYQRAIEERQQEVMAHALAETRIYLTHMQEAVKAYAGFLVRTDQCRRWSICVSTLRQIARRT